MTSVLIIFGFGVAAVNQSQHLQGAKETRTGSPSQQPEESLWIPTTWLPITDFTLALVIIGFSQAALFVWQLSLIQASTADAKLAAVAAMRAAKATEDSVDTMGDTAKRQLRAYIDFIAEGYQGLIDEGALGIGLAFRNRGQTPARNFNIIGVIDLLPYPLPDDYVLPTCPERSAQDGLLFPSGAPIYAWVWERESPPQPLSKEIKAAILLRNNPEQIYAHGTATYTDVFEADQKIDFCFCLNSMSVTRDNTGKIAFQWSPVKGRNKFT